MGSNKVLLIIVSFLIVIAIPMLLFSENRQLQLEELVSSEEFANTNWLAAFWITALFSVDIFLPIPSSVVCAVAGKIFGFLVGTFLCWTGLNLSSLLGYFLGRTLGFNAVRRFSDEQKIQEIQEQVERWGVWPLITFRPLPVLAEASILFVAMYRYPGRKFWPAILAANLLVAAAFVGLGKWFADQDQFLLGIVVCSVIPPGLLLLWMTLRSKN